MVDRPKRRKSKDNPYTLSYDANENKYYVEFKDIENKKHYIEVSKEVYNAMDRFELDDLSEMNEFDRHIEHTEIYELTLNKRLLHKEADTSEIIEIRFMNSEVKKAINKLSRVQKRRIELYFFEDKTLEEIAQIENTTFQAVSETIRNGIKTIRNILKMKKI